MRLPASSYLPSPTASTRASIGFSLAVSGMMMWPRDSSVAATRFTRRRSYRGRTFIGNSFEREALGAGVTLRNCTARAAAPVSGYGCPRRSRAERLADRSEGFADGEPNERLTQECLASVAVACRVLPTIDVMDRINDFLRQELASVDGYQKALRTLKKKADADGEHILQLAADHQRTVTA